MFVCTTINRSYKDYSYKLDAIENHKKNESKRTTFRTLSQKSIRCKSDENN